MMGIQIQIRVLPILTIQARLSIRLRRKDIVMADVVAPAVHVPVRRSVARDANVIDSAIAGHERRLVSLGNVVAPSNPQIHRP